jgi:hypothetical protein
MGTEKVLREGSSRAMLILAFADASLVPERERILSILVGAFWQF